LLCNELRNISEHLLRKSKHERDAHFHKHLINA